MTDRPPAFDAAAEPVQPPAHSPHSPFPPEVAAARADAGRAIRDLGHALIGHHAAIADVEALTADLRRWTGRLDHGARRDRVIERPTGDWGPPPADGEEMSSFDERPVSGRASPYGLDLRVVRDGDEVVGMLTLRSAHEGAPGRSHGGIISALFDDVFGFLLTVHGQPAFTGELKIRYQQGVPIHVPLECRTRITGQDGRKIYMAGELGAAPAGGSRDGASVEPAVFTRAEATFIAIDPEQYRIGAAAG